MNRAPSLPNPNNPLELLGFGITHYPGSVAFIPLYTPAHPERTLIVKTQLKDKVIPPHMRELWMKQNPNGNGNDGGNTDPSEAPTHIETGRVVCIMPSDVIRNYRGPDADRDVIMLMLVKREVYDRAASGLIVPASMSGKVVLG